MDGFNFNRIATGILLASFIVLLVSNVVDLLYEHDELDQPRGYSVDTSSGRVDKAAQEDVQLDFASLMSNANADKGKAVAKKCITCHTLEKGGANRVGPNLWKIIGAKKCHSQGFTYSKAMSGKGGDWSEEELFKFLANPQGYVSGTRMSFAGLSKPQDIADLLAYLKSLE